MLALEHDHPGCGREMVGGGDAGDAGADDGEIEILHEPHIARSLPAACNSWAAMNIAHLLLGAAQEFRDLTGTGARRRRPISAIATCGARFR